MARSDEGTATMIEIKHVDRIEYWITEDDDGWWAICEVITNSDNGYGHQFGCGPFDTAEEANAAKESAVEFHKGMFGEPSTDIEIDIPAREEMH